MIIGKGLGDVVVGAFAQGLDRRLDARVCGNDDAHHLGVEIPNAAQQIESAAATTQVQVENRHIDVLALKDAEGAIRTIGLEYFITLAAEQLSNNRAH